MTELRQQPAPPTLYGTVVKQSEPSRIYWVMNALATVIACYGLFTNSPAVVIGAMVVAMLLGPIAGISLGINDKDGDLFKMALFSLVAGVIWIVLIAIIIGSIHQNVPLTKEIIARTNPTLFDLMIALAGGAAGAMAMISPQIGTAIVGVAIATALVPPLSASGILMARGEWVMAGGAFTLALTNIVAIQFAFSAVLWAGGNRKLSKTEEQDKERGVMAFIRRDAIDLTFLGVLAVILTFNLHHVVSEELFVTEVRTILSRQINVKTGFRLAEVRLQTDHDKTIVHALVRGPKPPSTRQVAAMQASLPPLPKGNRLELLLRFVKIDIISAQGPLYFDDTDRYGYYE